MLYWFLHAVLDMDTVSVDWDGGSFLVYQTDDTGANNPDFIYVVVKEIGYIVISFEDLYSSLFFRMVLEQMNLHLCGK